MKSLKGKVVVITGAASGLGRSLALQCAGRGANLALCDRDEVELHKVCDEAAAVGVRVVSQVLDVSDPNALAAFAGIVLAELGPAHVLINNAGVALSAEVRHMQRPDFDWLFAINFWGVVNGCSAFLPQLRLVQEAHIVTISSIFGLLAVPGQSAYCASKFALRGYTDALRIELRGSPIAVTLVHPGGLRTNIIRHGRHQALDGQPQDVSQLAKDFDRIAQTSPDEAATRVLRAIGRKRPRLIIGWDAFILDICSRIWPVATGHIFGRIVRALERWRHASVKGGTTADTEHALSSSPKGEGQVIELKRMVP